MISIIVDKVTDTTSCWTADSAISERHHLVKENDNQFIKIIDEQALIQL